MLETGGGRQHRSKREREREREKKKKKKKEQKEVSTDRDGHGCSTMTTKVRREQIARSNTTGVEGSIDASSQLDVRLRLESKVR
ncbi:hypothetical protein HYC85_028298 [Camellia sinensis]|uniref:Uncharacterized protein n=1 Tax=Camellia sinensis TaxID=4442 RepID=A0A7J7FVI8_CAMSI|nr:hypothetical protein HYC85_028298 [Camellia sinensis]